MPKMFTKIWNYLFGRTTPAPALPPAPPVEEPAYPGFNVFHALLLEEASKRLEREKEYLASDKLFKALRRATAYMMSHDDIFMSARDIDIPEDMMALFYSVFSKLCQEQKIKCELTSGKYIRVDKGTFDAVLISLQDEARGTMIDDKVRQMYSVGIYR